MSEGVSTHENAPSGSRVKDRRVKRVLTRFGEVEVCRRRYVYGSGTHRYPLGKLHGPGPCRHRDRVLVHLEPDVSALVRSRSLRMPAQRGSFPQ